MFAADLGKAKRPSAASGALRMGRGTQGAQGDYDARGPDTHTTAVDESVVSLGPKTSIVEQDCAIL